MSNAKAPKVTPVSALKKYADCAEVVELPGWEEGVPFVCKLRRAMLRVLVIAGKIPNPLMAAAQRLYEGNNSKASAKLDETLKTMEIVIRSAMVEPTYDELEEADIVLTEEQMLAIFLYAQSGVNALASFRQKSGDTDAGSDGKAMADAAQ